MDLGKPYYLIFLALIPLFYYLRGRGHGAREKAPFVLRMVAIFLLTLALAGLAISGGKGLVNAIYAIDVSRSMGQDSPERVLRLVSEAAERHEEVHSGSAILFGAGSRPLFLPRPGPAAAPGPASLKRYTEGPMTNGTDIAGALQRAAAYFKEGAANRVVLFTDGNQTHGDGVAAAGALRAMGGELFVVPVDGLTKTNEVAIENLRVPPRVKAMEPFRMLLTVKSEGEVEARMDILRDGLQAASREVELKAGVNNFSFRDSIGEEGLHHYRAVVYPLDDGMRENNSYEAFVEVSHSPRILIVHGEEQESRFLLQALRTQGFNVASGSAEELPTRYPDYTGYAAIILQDVPGLSISRGKMELLERYVRDAGGGLVIIGGDKSLGAGGYYHTPLERVLPVTMDSPSGLTVPAVALLLVIDKSDSMSVRVGKTDKLELAKMASYSAVELMRPFDRVGLLAFDSHHFWAVPMTHARDRGKVAERLRTISPGGGTDLYPALKEAYYKLKTENAAIKHVLILSDGLTEDKGFDSLVRAMASDKITASTVAMGDDADVQLMERIARNGGGRYFFAYSAENVPTIFLAEAMLISRRMVVEGEIAPTPVNVYGILKSIDIASLPPLKGYIRTFPRETSRIILASPRGDPLLATWQYGLGRVAVFTSDLSHRWGKRWVQWEEFGKFAAHLVRQVSAPPTPHQVEVAHELEGSSGRLIADLYGPESSFINLVDLRGRLMRPDGGVQELSFTQTAPGRYESDFDAGPVGPYFINLYGRDGHRNVRPHTAGFAVSYGAEYASWGVDREFLGELTRAGGGKVLELHELEDEIYRIPHRKAGALELWHLLAWAALLCYVMSIVISKWPRVRRPKPEGPGVPR